MVGIAQPALGLRPAVPVPVQSPAMLPTAVAMESKVLDKRRLQELVKEVDPLEQLDEDVEEVHVLYICGLDVFVFFCCFFSTRKYDICLISL